MEIASAIGIGVISGLITGFATIVFGQVTRKMVLPWYNQFTYKGLIISGSWRVVPAGPDYRRDIVLELEQHANKVKGISTHILKNKEDEGDYVRTYKLDGEINDRLLTIVGRNIDTKRIGRYTLMVELIGDGQQMKGVISGYRSVKRAIEGTECTLERIKDSSVSS